MIQGIVLSILVLGAAFAAFALALTGVGGLQMARKARDGLMPYFYYPLFAASAMLILFSGRTYDASGGALESMGGNPLSEWSLRLTSVFALLASADQIVRYFAARPKIEATRAILVLTFLYFWVTNSVLPSFMGAHPMPMRLNWFYCLLVIPALILMSPRGAEISVKVFRNAVIGLISISFLLIPISSSLVLDRDYSQGYIAGLPRFTGLAAHAILMATFSTIAIWCLLVEPYQKKWVNRMAWLVCLSALVLTQSKTIWVSFFVATPVLLYYQRGLPRLRDFRTFKVLPVFVVLMAVSVGMVLAVYLLFGGGVERIAGFSNSSEGAQLLSMTGRDKIWAVALEEWRKSPIFGYGLSLFSEDFRKIINMPAAFHAHSQVIDSLSRSGIIGASGTVFYLTALTWAGFRYARTSHGLSAALVVLLLSRSVSEISLSALGIGVLECVQYMLLTVIAASITKEKLSTSPASRNHRARSSAFDERGRMSGSGAVGI